MGFPLLYEINTRCWLQELSERSGQVLTLATVPEAELASWRRLGFTHIWLMGVWCSGPRARLKALAEPCWPAYTEALPGWREEDVTGSPYAIAEYRVLPALGGDEALRQFRQRLHGHGLKLLLDFVPNHLGLDHPWLHERPELFVQAPAEAPGTFLQATRSGPRWLAHGKDPYFEAWTDTVQLDYRRPETRAAMTELLLSVAARCDGVRCDMAMLVLSEVCRKTWERFPGTGQGGDSCPGEFWTEAIAAVRTLQPDFLFLAEAYWGLEARLRELGFDYTYDKALYDRLIARDGPGVQRYLLELPPLWLAGGAHFLENHDEPRVAAQLPLAAHRAAALLMLGLPGLRFLHEGQLAGVRRRVPVQLLRRLPEPVQPGILEFYEQFLEVLSRTAIGHGHAELIRPHRAWPDNPTAENLLMVKWQSEPEEFDLVTVNLAPHSSQGYAHLDLPGNSVHGWSMRGLLDTENYVRPGDEMQTRGLYLDLPAYGAQIFRFQPAAVVPSLKVENR